MRSLLIAAATLLLGSAPSRVDVVAYSLTPELKDNAITALVVTVRFNGDASGTTRFDWTGDWAGEADLGQWARDIVVSGATTTELAPHGGRIIHAVPRAPLTVTYRIVSAYPGDPTVDDSKQSKPVVRPSWFYATGESLFAVPVGRGGAVATFNWTGAEGIGFASDLEHAASSFNRSTKTVHDIVESIVIGGRDLHVVASQAGGAPLRIATVGQFGFDRAAFDHMAQGIVEAERRFWKSRDRQPYLIAMTPLVPVAGHRSLSGTGRGDAFALWIDVSSDMTKLSWLLAHEYFHTWNSRQLGALAEDGTEAESYWLSEGFTDFYSQRLMLRAGLMTAEQFVDKWNATLIAYSTSRFRTAGNVAASKLYWQDYEAERLPYQRGAMLAALWEWRQRAGRGYNLDSVLLDQRRLVLGLASPPPLVETFISVAATHGLDVRDDIARYLDRGEALILPKDAFGRCATVTTTTRPAFDRGYDGTATAKAANVITGLDPKSPAYAAGLRDGQKVLRRTSGTPGDSTVDYELVVLDRGIERVIRFRPVGSRTETVQQIVLNHDLFNRASKSCAAALAG